jgi:ankyrin repeat protein
MSVNLSVTDEFTTLHISAGFDKLEATKTLIHGGAALNKFSKYGDTVLTVASRRMHLEICRFLTEIGADNKYYFKTTLFFTWLQPWIVCIISSKC